MVRFPGCKINLGLRVLAKRTDGFHDIETIFYPIKWNDVVEIIPSTSTSKFSTSGIEIDGNSSSNLCLKAYNLLKQDFPLLPNCDIHLHKNIPIGAGLGGGSADASSVLLMLNEMFELNISMSQLENHASLLGSDCPFFIHNKPMLATGRGEVLSPIDVSLENHAIVLINPGIAINTKWAFSTLVFQQHDDTSLGDMIKLPIESWQDKLKNDFEIPIFSAYPEIAAVKEKLLTAGALYSSMSGSGSTVFGIFKKKIDLQEKFPASYILHWV